MVTLQEDGFSPIDNFLEKIFIPIYKVEQDVDRRSNVMGSVVIKSDENK